MWRRREAAARETLGAVRAAVPLHLVAGERLRARRPHAPPELCQVTASYDSLGKFLKLTKYISPIRKSSAVNRDSDSPIVVHCSAGVGRTGVYIVLDAMLRQMKCKCELGLVTYLMHIRTQRNYLVQVRDLFRRGI